MAVVGDATVVIRAVATRVRDDIRRALQSAKSDVEKEGREAGKLYGDRFSQTATRSIKTGLRDGLNSTQTDAARAGQNAGTAYGDNFSNGVTSRITSDITAAFDSLTNPAGAAGTDAGDLYGTNFSQAAQRQISSKLQPAFDGVAASAGTAGQRAGSALGDGLAVGAERGADRSALTIERRFEMMTGRVSGFFSGLFPPGFIAEASNISRAFTTIYAAGMLLGPALMGLVGGLSSVVGGLFAMASAAGQAVGALGALPGLIGVLLQSVVALKVAFGGVGEAIKSGMASATKSTNETSKATSAAARQVESAQIRVSRAYEDAARRNRDAAQRVQRAEENLADAQFDSLRAQEDLNRARERAAETLQQLGFDAEGAALAEERAAMRLEDAYQELQEAAGYAPDSRERREAELAFKEAELGYREAKDRAADLAEEQEKAAAAGIDGTEEVVSAMERIDDANKRVADAERGLADAREAQADAAVQNQRAIEDAQRALADALNAQAQAASSSSASLNKYNEALSKLSPEAQEFVRTMVSLKGAYQEFRNEVGKDLFPALTESVKTLVRVFLPEIAPLLRTTAGIFGTMATNVTGFLTSAEGLKLIKSVMEGNNQILSIFNRENETGRTNIESFVAVVLRLLEAVQPLTERFAEWVAGLVAGWDAQTQTAEGMEKLTGFFDRAGDRAALLGDVFGSLWDVLSGLGGAAAPAGVSLLQDFVTWLDELKVKIDEVTADGSLGEWFANAGENMKSVLGVLGDIIGELFKLGGNPAIGEAAEGLRPLADNIGEIGRRLVEAGPALSELAVKISEIFLALTDSGQIETFVGILTRAADIVAGLAQSPFGAWLIGVVGMFAAAHRALAVLGNVGKWVFKLIIGSIANMMKGLTGAVSGTLKFGRTLGNVLTGKGLPKSTKATDPASAASAGAASFDENMEKLGRQFDITGDAKDRFIQNLKVLDSQFDRTGPTGGAAGAAAAAGADVVDDLGESIQPELLRDATDSVVDFDTKTTKATKTPGKFGRAFSKMGGMVKGGMGLASKGLSLVGGPIGLILMLLPAIIAGFKKFYDSNEGFREFVDTVVKKFGELMQKLEPVIAWISDLLVNVLAGAFTVTWNILSWAFTQISTGFSAVGTAFSWVWENVLKPISGFFVSAWEGAKNAFVSIRDFFVNAWDAIGNGLQWVYDNVISPVIDFFIGRWENAKTNIGIIKDFLVNAWNAIGDGLEWVYDKLIAPVIDFMLQKWEDFKRGIGIIRDALKIIFESIGNALKWVYDNIIVVTINFYKDKFFWLRDRISESVEKIKGFFSDMGNNLKYVYDTYIVANVNKIKDKFEEIRTTVRGVVDGAKEIFNDLASAPKQGVIGLINFINDKMIDSVNKITSNFGLTIPKIPMPRFAEGGLVDGPGTGTSDSIIARVSRGEYIMPAKRVQSIGVSALESMRSGKSAPFAVGGGSDFFKNPMGAITSWIGNGIGWALEKLLNTIKPTFNATGYVGDFFEGILDKLVAAAKSWGDKKEEENSGGGDDISTKGIGTGPWRRPMSRYRITSRYGARWGGFHAGTDLAAGGGNPIYSASTGRVVRARYNAVTGRTGLAVVLAHANALYTYYGHLARALVSVGQNVGAGSRIGIEGSTGRVTGPHLHFETHTGRIGRTVNPETFLRARGIRLATGGIVQPYPGGTLAMIAEAGKAERVEPLDSRGLSERDYAMIKALAQVFVGDDNNSGRGPRFYITNHYPVAEPTSKTINRAGQFAAAIGEL